MVDVTVGVVFAIGTHPRKSLLAGKAQEENGNIPISRTSPPLHEDLATVGFVRAQAEQLAVKNVEFQSAKPTQSLLKYVG